MENRRAQIAMEYLVLTAFILVAVAIIFSFTFVNYSESIRAAKTTESLSKLANAVDDVYTRGEGNTRFVEVNFPDGMKGISIVQKCDSGSSIDQGTALECKDGRPGDEYAYVDFSAIAMEVKLFSGDTTLLEGTRAKIFGTLGGNMSQTIPETGLNKYSGSTYTVKVSWTGSSLIQIGKV